MPHWEANKTEDLPNMHRSYSHSLAELQERELLQQPVNPKIVRMLAAELEGIEAELVKRGQPVPRRAYPSQLAYM